MSQISFTARAVLMPGLLAICAYPHQARADEAAPSFRNEVLPILSGHCFECHGFDPGTRFPKDEPLRLDGFDHAMAVRQNGSRAIAPGDPKASLIMQRVRERDPELVMPPPNAHKPLSSEQILTLERWIAAGAKYERHWAFSAPEETTPIPEITDKSWPRNSIDHFILARLEKEKLAPSTPAIPERWLRRATLHLTGLPPARAEIDAYLADTSPTAKEAVVDRLLASPRFGEQMAVSWLDVARYADSFGYQADIDLKAWPYRDWVINAFNNNLPFDEFITQQLAGDLLPGATRDQKLATAFNRIHRKTNEGGSVPEEYRQEGISDRIHTIGIAFMALTLECARCHDHKYDPISAKDYYSMGAFFNSIDEFGLIGYGNGILPQPALELPSPAQETQLIALKQQIIAAEAVYTAHLAAAEPAFQAWLTSAEKTFPVADLAGRFSFDATPDALASQVNPEHKANIGANKSAPGRIGNGVLTNGDATVSIPDYGIRSADQPFSVSLWLKPAEDYPRAVVFQNTTSADVPYSGYEVILENGKLSWSLALEFPGNAATIATTGTIPSNEWTHITVTNDGSRKASGLKIYRNGQPAETTVRADTLTRNFVSGDQISFTARSRDPGLRGGMVDEISVHTRAITPAEAASIFSGKPLAETTDPALLRDYYLSAIDPAARDLSAKLTAARSAYRDAQNGVSEIVTMRESATPIPAHILTRGDYTMIAEKVERETPGWLPPFPADQPRNRLGFARWLTSPDHPLTARVTINRIWQEIFGVGIVESSDNFGLQGAQPSHPELLDWLARDFINHGWDHKRAIKQMVLSATYAQDSIASPELRERDPANALLARGPARRLTAEMLRDSALAHSGLLAETLGGPPVKPYQAPGSMWKELNNFLPVYTPDKGEGLYRRSLYTFWRRTTTPPNMMIFDSTTREVCSTRRQITNTPLQALVLLNDPQFVEAARKIGERISHHGGDTDEARAAWAWREVIGTSPAPAQLDILLDLMSEQRALFQANPTDAAALLKAGDSPADPALDAIESATFTVLAQALINLDAHITLR
ncbi:MAG: DUF1553 domain-containing protein [Akkermansiaceae bacterium]